MAWLDLIVEFSPTLNSEADNWVDITDQVETIQIGSGRSDELSQFQAGTCQIRLRNDDRRFDPLYVDGPYYGKLLPKRKFRVRSTYLGEDFRLFTGYCRGFPQVGSYVDNRLWCDIECADAFELFATIPILGCFATHTTYHDPDVWAWYRFQDQENIFDGVTTATDSGPNGLHGTYTPRGRDYSWGDSLIRDGSSFEPGGDTWIEFPNHDYLAGSTTKLTLEFSLKADHIPTYGPVFGSDGSFTAYLYDFDDLSFGPGRIVFQVGMTRSTSGKYTVTAKSDKVLTDNTWHHIVLTVDTVDQEINLYIDGELERYTFFSEGGGITYTLWNAPTETFRIGRGTSSGLAIPADEGISIGEMTFYNVEKDSTWVSSRYAEILGFPGESSGARINRILDIAEWPTGDRDIATGNSLISADTGGTVLGSLQETTEAELGLLYVDGAGIVTFKSRVFYLADDRSADVQAFYADSGPDIRYVDVERSEDDQYIFNVGEASRDGGPTFTFVDETSAAEYFRRVSSKTGLKLYNDNEARALAQWLATRQTQPETRVEALKLDLRDNPLTPYFAMIANLADRVQVMRQPQSLGASWIVSGIIDMIQHDISLADRTFYTTFKLAPLDDETILILGGDTDSVDSPLGF